MGCNPNTFEIYVENNLTPESILVKVICADTYYVMIENGSDLPVAKAEQKYPSDNNAIFGNTPVEFVRIPSNESYSIPVSAQNKYRIIFITVYVEDLSTKNLLCIADNYPTNRRIIEIKRNTHKH